MLNTKLPVVPARLTAPVVVPVSIPTPPKSKLQRFEEVLLQELQRRPNTAHHRKQCILDITAKADFKELTFQEIDQALARVDQLFPPPPSKYR